MTRGAMSAPPGIQHLPHPSESMDSTLQSSRSAWPCSFHPSPPLSGSPVHFLFALRPCVSFFILATSRVHSPEALLLPPSLWPSGLLPRAAHRHILTPSTLSLIGRELLREEGAAWQLVTGPGPHRSWLTEQVVRNGGRLPRAGVG